MTTETLAPAKAGRTHTCEQCGIVYDAQRSTSRFCSERCKKRAQRGAPKSDPEAARAATGLLTWLTKSGFVGSIGNGGLRLTVPLTVVQGELDAVAARLKSKGLRSIAPASPSGLRATLRDLRVRV